MTTNTNTCKAWTTDYKNERVTVEITRKGVVLERCIQRGLGYYNRERELVAQGGQFVILAIVWLTLLDEPTANAAASWLAQLQDVNPWDTVADLFTPTLFD